MSQPASSASTCGYEDMPLPQLLFRYLWPFWLFRDANCGDRYARAAAYRHNRGMRIYLPGYLLKWLVSCAVALALTHKLAGLAGDFPATINVFTLMAAGTGMLFACALCILLVTAYIYFYLCRNEN